MLEDTENASANPERRLNHRWGELPFVNFDSFSLNGGDVFRLQLQPASEGVMSSAECTWVLR